MNCVVDRRASAASLKDVKLKFPASLLVLLLLAGCHNGWFGGSRSSSGSGRSANPRAATARAQNWMRTSIDMELGREKRGEHPPSGRNTWRDYWEWRISLWHKDKKSHQYEQYLARRRKELGLPEVRRL